jgi:hypothetical protein
LFQFKQIIQNLQNYALSLNKNVKISPQTQINYYQKQRGQLLKDEETKLLSELFNEDEIREITVIVPT